MAWRLPGILAMITLVASGSTWADTRITGSAYMRQDGGSDDVIETCGNLGPATGGGRLRQNEPAVAIKPDETSFIVASANDSCTVPLVRDAWQGLYVSSDGGRRWTDSLLPGYPGDTSAAGQASPLFGLDSATSDPLLAWDTAGNLFMAGIAFNRTVATGSSLKGNANAFVATFRRDPASPLGIAYTGTVIVGEGTPSDFPNGRFSDKPGLRVDTWAPSPYRGNVYFAWSLFTSVPSRILFARSTDQGRTFSRPMTLSGTSGQAQGPAVAVAPDGAVYVVWREFAAPSNAGDGIVFVRSTDGGQTFGAPRRIRSIVPYDRVDVLASGGSAVNCGDGPFLCLSGFTFHRTTSFPDAMADVHGNVYVAWEQMRPAPGAGDTYGPVGQAQAAVTKSTNGGASWSATAPVDPEPVGHQFFPRLAYDHATDSLALLYYDSREDPAYAPTRPPGTRADGTSPCQTASGVGASRCDVLNAFVAVSHDAGATWAATKLSQGGHQPEYEIAGDTRVPFHGDYLGIDAAGGSVYATWTDNRDAVPGTDPRDAVSDGFDVVQCRAVLADGSIGPDTCPNAGGRNQNVYGAGLKVR